MQTDTFKLSINHSYHAKSVHSSLLHMTDLRDTFQLSLVDAPQGHIQSPTRFNLNTHFAQPRGTYRLCVIILSYFVHKLTAYSARNVLKINKGKWKLAYNGALDC